MELADRIAVLRDGNLISVSQRKEVTVNQIIEDMVGRKLHEMYPKQQIPVGEIEFEVENLTVEHPYIPNHNIVEDVHFSVKKGEILGISGLVGSERSETVNAIFGSMKKTSGILKLEGKEIAIGKPQDAIDYGIGLVTEDRKRSGIISPMNLRENMTIASLKAISSRGVINRKKEKELSGEYYGKLKVKASGIEDNIMNLSGGNQQKIVLSKWLMKDIKVLILDEPTRGVDVGAKVEIYHIITKLTKNGVAVIMISSELPELLGMCDRILVLGRGKVWGNMFRRDFSQERIMRAATCIEKWGV
ncbi:MAG: ATP-binding cassette domain-containing protein [Lachnospiraceae bacterium]|nr:ATP-binding cassette domain-containing protein [Lachnospiraceae bacterium]